VKELQNLLGVMNFYHRFIIGVALLHRLLTESFKGSPKAPVEGLRRCGQYSKRQGHPVCGHILGFLQAADRAGPDGGSIHRAHRSSPNGPLETAGFFSEKLDSTETSYLAYNRDLLTWMSGIRHF